MFEKIIQITATGSKVEYQSIGIYCDNCRTEIHVGRDHRKAFRQVICKCRWQLIHERELPRDNAEWRRFWWPWHWRNLPEAEPVTRNFGPEE